MEWNKGNVGVLVCNLPNRKKPVLCVRRGEKIAKIGTLNSEDDAKAFQMFMDVVMGGADGNAD